MTVKNVWVWMVLLFMIICPSIHTIHAQYVRKGLATASSKDRKELTPHEKEALARHGDVAAAITGKHMQQPVLLSSSYRGGNLHKVTRGGNQDKKGLDDGSSQETNDEFIADIIPRRKRRVEVRNLQIASCEQGGTQYTVQCTKGSEEYCYEELIKVGAVIVNRLVGNDFFVVCVNTPHELAVLNNLTNVVELEVDPVRTLSYVRELTQAIDIHTDVRSGQTVPYGVSMVKADAFWSQDRGGNSRVCIIDTGLYTGHEDLVGATYGGSSNSGKVVTPYDQDQSGHGTHVAGTVAAVDNNVGVVGVAPDADLFIVRGTYSTR